MYDRCLSPTQEGTLQGGIISPTLANMTLDEIESLLKVHFPKQPLGKSKSYIPKVHLVRYADDFIVKAADKELLERAKCLIAGFLTVRGLLLSGFQCPQNTTASYSQSRPERARRR